jgi:hypothetical protein
MLDATTTAKQNTAPRLVLEGTSAPRWAPHFALRSRFEKYNILTRNSKQLIDTSQARADQKSICVAPIAKFEDEPNRADGNSRSPGWSTWSAAS